MLNFQLLRSYGRDEILVEKVVSEMVFPSVIRNGELERSENKVVLCEKKGERFHCVFVSMYR